MNRIWHPFHKWEEYRSGMWSTVGGMRRKQMLEAAIRFTGDHELYGQWMQRVVMEWPISCEHNLSDVAQNRRAWVGHAAVAMAEGIPEDIVREAWAYLTDEQRRLANLQADRAIETWEKQRTWASVQLELMF